MDFQTQFFGEQSSVDAFKVKKNSTLLYLTIYNFGSSCKKPENFNVLKKWRKTLIRGHFAGPKNLPKKKFNTVIS